MKISGNSAFLCIFCHHNIFQVQFQIQLFILSEKNFSWFASLSLFHFITNTDLASMAIFIKFKKYFAFLGIKPDGRSHFNATNLLIIFLCAFCFIGMSEFLFFEPKSLMEYGNSFYGAILGVSR